jgi:prophage maintenance system killer protein
MARSRREPRWRSKGKWQYGPRVDPPMLAAAFAFGLVRNHPYRDGNKRIRLAMVD